METDEQPAVAAADEKPVINNPRIFLNKTFIISTAVQTGDEEIFRKSEMKQRIVARGGIVLEDINQVPLDAEAYLISSTHYRTHKYLAAMSRGMPCLSHKWLIACCDKEEFVPFEEYKLPAGVGLLDGELYPLRGIRGKLLVGRTIMVYSKTDAAIRRGTMGFKQIWSPIVELLGGRVMPDTCLMDCAANGGDVSKMVVPDGFTILLTDSSCPTDVVQQLEAAGKAVVSSEWLIQSIIMGACPDFTAHPRFRYDSGIVPAAGAVKKEPKPTPQPPLAPLSPAEMNPRIFLNKTFILTSANRTTNDVVFRKNEMKKQILERGGIVLEDINQLPLDAEAYLISDTHYRTHKYLFAMSRGMPCLSHKWLIACCSKEEFVPFEEYKLAGGQGLLDGVLYPLPDVRGKLLVGRTIMVHSSTGVSIKRGVVGFEQIWSPIVELLGGRVMPDTCLTDCAANGGDASKMVVPDDLTILLTDSSCPTDVVQKLEAAGKAVVSSEWLIQSIIMGACPDFTAHPRFRYDSGTEPAARAVKKEPSKSIAEAVRRIRAERMHDMFASHILSRFAQHFSNL